MFVKRVFKVVKVKFTWKMYIYHLGFSERYPITPKKFELSSMTKMPAE